MSELKSKFVSRIDEGRHKQFSPSGLVKNYTAEISFVASIVFAIGAVGVCSTSLIAHWLTHRTNESIERRNYEDTLNKLNMVLTFDPLLDEALLDRARILTKLHKYQSALNDYNSVLSRNPNRVDALERRAALCVLLRRSDQTLADCDKLLTIEGDKASVYVYADRAIAYSMLGKKQNAADDYTSAIRIKPNEKAFYLGRADNYRDMAKYSDALEDYEWVQEFNPGDEDAAIGKASCFSLQKNYPKAFNYLNQAINSKYKTAKLFTARGKLYWATNQIDNALKDFNSALALDPKNVDALTERLRVHTYKQDEQKALQDANLLVQLGSTDYDMYMRRADLQSDLGRYAIASMGYDVASQLKPNEAEPFIRKAKVEALQKHYTSAMKQINVAIKLLPNDPDLVAQRGMYTYQAGDADGGKADFEKALSLNPGLFRAYLYRGEVAYEQHDYVNAKEDFAKALRLRVDDADAKFYLGLANKELSKSKPAVVASPDSSTAVALAPQVTKLIANGSFSELSAAGASAYQSGRYRDAINILSKAVKLSPTIAEPRRMLAASLMAANYLPQAAIQYRSVITLDPGKESDYSALGKALYDSHQYAEATDAYEKLLQLKPRDFNATKQLILSYKAAGMTKKAEGICVDAIHSTSGVEELQQYESLLKSFNKSAPINGGPKVAPIKDALDTRG